MPSIEAPESSSPIVTRAVAAGLRGEFFDTYPFPSWQKALLTVLGALPQGVARFAISQFEQALIIFKDGLWTCAQHGNFGLKRHGNTLYFHASNFA